MRKNGPTALSSGGHSPWQAARISGAAIRSPRTRGISRRAQVLSLPLSLASRWKSLRTPVLTRGDIGEGSSREATR